MSSDSNRERAKFNRKRKIRNLDEWPNLENLAEQVNYDGNPTHKRNPGDFCVGAEPRDDKTLCDLVGIFAKSDALRLLRAGVDRGLVSGQSRGGFPQNIWAVTDDGYPLEAQQGSPGQGIYHGYPLVRADALWDKVLKRWNQA